MEFFNDNGTDPLKPSLFELVAQEQLRDLLQPALKYVLAVCDSFCALYSGSMKSRYLLNDTRDTSCVL